MRNRPIPLDSWQIDRKLHETAGDISLRPQEKKPAKVLDNPVLFSGTILKRSAMSLGFIFF